MKCKEVRKYFDKFSENTEISEHLKECKACKEEYRQFLALQGILEKARSPRKDESFWDKYVDEIEDKLRDLPQREKIKKLGKIELPMFLKQPVYAAAAVVVLITGIFMYNRWGSGESEADFYSNSLGFFLEEFENVASENLFSENFPLNEEDIRLLINSQVDINNENN